MENDENDKTLRETGMAYVAEVSETDEMMRVSFNEALLSRIERGMRLGDAAILWVAETCGCEALVTRNTRHFIGKTELPVLTPAEWLEKFAGK